MLVIGIDPGTATSGYGLVEKSQKDDLTAIKYGVITTPPDLPMPERLLFLYHSLKTILSDFQPEEGAVEKLFFQTNVRTAISVGQSRGVALLSLAQAKVSVGEYSPLEVKQAVVGYGKAAKRQVQIMIQMLLNLPNLPYPDDAADALAVALCHIQHDKMKNILQEVKDQEGKDSL